jgi:putative ABC transport system permease protein
MFRTYIFPAFTRIARAPVTSGANILTRALGLACFIAAWGIATYWRSADGYHSTASRTFVIGQSNTGKGQVQNPLSAMSNWMIARYLPQDFPEVERVGRAWATPDVAVDAGVNKLLLNQGTVDPEFLSIFDLDFVSGDPRTALSSADSLVLTQDAAQRLFGRAPAMGQRVLVNAQKELTVTGVIRSVRQPSFMGDGSDAVFRFDMLRNWASNKAAVDMDNFASWIGLTPYTFVVLKPGATVEAVSARLPAFVERHIPATVRANAATIMRAFPIAGLTTFDLDRTLFASSGTNLSTVATLLALAALTLLIACVNYANLATAQASGRAKEVGMRRVLGAGVLRVMAQAWLEAIALTAIAALLAILVLSLAAPVIRTSTSIDILYFLAGGWQGIAVVAGLVLLVAFFAGAYPALILSQVRPVSALRSGRSRSGSRLVARVLVAIQFASASFLLILVTVTQLQREHLERSVLAPKEDPVVILNDLLRAGVDYDTLAARLSGQPGIKTVSVADIPPWSTLYNGLAVARSADPNARRYMIGAKAVGYDYFDVFSLKLLAGRTFNRQQDVRPTSIFMATGPEAQVIIDRKLSNSFGFATPEAAVGQTIHVPAPGGGPGRQAHIIGVTETEVNTLESNTAAGLSYSYMPRAMWGEQRPVVRLMRDQVPAALDSIERAFNELAPSIPAQIRFYSDQFEQRYRQYGRMSQLFILLASTAFIIASIGLLGIAVHVAAKRRHEIAVRKTLGSSAARVVRLLLADFSGPVLVGNLIAWPLAWLAAETYLRAFAERIELSPAPFIISTAITLAIAWAAIIGVVLRAATLRPAEVLRRA